LVVISYNKIAWYGLGFFFVCGYYVQYDRREMMGVAGMTKHCD